MKYNWNDFLSKPRRAPRRLMALLPLLLACVFAGSFVTSASAATFPPIAAVAYPATGTASVWGSGYTPYGEIHVWVYRNHQQVAYAVTQAAGDGSLSWYGPTDGYSTCHDEFDVQAYDVATNQLTANPVAYLGCARNPNLSLTASYTGDYSASIAVSGSQFSAGALVGIYVYRDGAFVSYFQTIATSDGSISDREPIPGVTYCGTPLDVVAYDFVSHQFSNDPNAGSWCIW